MKIAALSLLLGSVALGESPPLQKAEFAFKLRGYCHAYSKVITGPGGHGQSANFPKKAPSDLKLKSGIHLLLDTSTLVPFAEKYEGFRLRLVNSTAEAVQFNASDSRLDIVMQAQDSKGDWRDIEYLPQSWCGNSYHTVQLPAGEMWEFSVPKYSGSVHTKLRMAFTRSKSDRIYSAEFEGTVDPKQFTTEQGHRPTNVMDPYTK